MTDKTSAGSSNERSPADYAIEHGQYLAKSAEDFLTLLNDVAMAESALETWDEDDAEYAAAKARVDEAWEKRHDHWTGLQNAIYEFRKRAERVTPETRALPESLRDPVKALERGSMLLQLTEQRDIAWGALQAIKHGPPTWLNNDEVAGWAAREADKGFEPQAECEHGHNPRVCLECHPDEPPPVKAHVVACGNPVMVAAGWYGPCTKPSGHDGECERATANGLPQS